MAKGNDKKEGGEEENEEGKREREGTAQRKSELKANTTIDVHAPKL